MDRATLRERVATLQTIPTLPMVRDRAARMMDDPHCSIRDVGAIVGADPVLTARLLQAVDWRRNMFADKVPTAGKAISALGFEALRRLVQVQPVLDVTSVGPGDAGPFDLKELWLHCVGTATAARTIAEHIGYDEPEECFIAGLLHDIGKIVLWQLFPKRFDAALVGARRARTTFYQYEVDTGEASHAVMGRYLLEQWALPPKVIEAVGWHHTPQLAEWHPKIVAVIHMADILARALGLGSGGDPYVPPPKPAGLSSVGLRATQVEAVMTQIEQEFPRAAAPLS